MKTRVVLLIAKELIKRGWTPLGLAKHADGRRAEIPGPEAASYSLLGAIFRASWELDVLSAPAQAAVVKAMGGEQDLSRLCCWDTGLQSSEPVVALLDRAIAQCST